MQKITLLNIFRVFFKIGVILLGGGYVIVPILKEELIEKRHWLSEDEVYDYYCVAQCLPGIIAINTSILVGYRLKKFKGALISIFAMSLSPIISILIIANLVGKICNIPFVNSIFYGVNLSVIILIYLTLKDIWEKSIVDYLTAFWFVLILLLACLNFSPIILIVCSIIFGIILNFVKGNKNDK